MEKFQNSVLNTVPAGNHDISTFQLDGGEVEAQVKRIMISFGVDAGKLCTFQLGLFQKLPTAATDFDDETVVLSGAIGNQFSHNDTITMRVPKDWYIGILITNLSPAQASLTRNLQLNYKVLN